MAIKAYLGIQGSGKSYEVVSVVILGALRAGRRVVSNIAGLNYDLMRQMLIEEGADESLIGTLVNVEHEQVLEPNFWRTDKDEEQGIDSFIQPGDLLALDEIWRFWSGFSRADEEGKKRPERVMNFFRMHRHFSHPVSGLTCEVVLITQDINDIHRSVKGVIEQSYVMTQLTAVGLTSRYRVDVFTKYYLSRKPIRSMQKSYEPKYFPLYSSHSQKKEGAADAKQESVDKRGNLLLGKRFVLIIPVMILAAILAFNNVYKYFHPQVKTHEQAANPATDNSPSQNSPKTAPNAVPAEVPQPRSSWRIVGFYQKGQLITLVLRNDAGTTRYVIDPPNIRLAGLDIGAVLGTEVYSNWSGAEIQKRTP